MAQSARSASVPVRTGEAIDYLAGDSESRRK
jgi:hypothetical protein